MNRTATLLGLALTLASLAASGPLKVTAVVPPKPYYAGQGIEVRVEVDPIGGKPTFETPRVKDAEVCPLPADPTRPSRARFVVVPGHAGTLDLPAFRARSGDGSGASRPMKLLVANPPPDGRTSAFLGGVGPFDVRAEAEPSSVRLGETLEFRVKITGPAAWGSVRAPALNEWASPTLRLEPGPDQLQAGDPPVRMFRYRLRPLKSGKVTLPPVSVSAFDPTTRRYATKATSSLTIRVEDPPRFDPARLDYPAVAARPRASRPMLVGLTVGTTTVSGSLLAAWVVARRRRKSRKPSPRALALELAKALESGDDEVEAARAIVEALTTFLHRVGGRTPGVLTPSEARAGFDRVADDPALGGFAEALVTRCDRARYGRTGHEARELVAEGRGFLGKLAEANFAEGREGGGPGEAVGTASNL